jgi:hypothetical protein
VGVAGGTVVATAVWRAWIRSPRFWLAATAVLALAVGVACGIEAIMVEPVRLGFGISAVSFLLAAGGCAVAAIRHPSER